MPPFSEIAAQLGSTVEIPPSVEEKDNSPEGKEARRQKRMEQCGWLIDKTNAAKGCSKMCHRFCKNPKCPTCRRYRQNDLRQRLDLATREHELRVVYLPDGMETDALLVKLGKENYWRFPGEQADTIIVNQEALADSELSVSLPLADVELDWDVLASRVSGRKLSGNLGKEQPVVVSAVEEGETMTYTDHTIVACHTDEEDREVSGPTAEEFKQAETEGVLATLELRPRTAQELEVALCAFVQAKITSYKQMGLKVIRVETKQVTSKHFLLDWGEIREKVSAQHTWQMELTAPKSVESSLYSMV